MTTDEPVDAYFSAAAPPGSIDYFVVLFSHELERPSMAAALALGHVVTNIARQATEADVRRLKLGWWLEEIAMTRAGQARHPLTVALSTHRSPDTWLPRLERLVATTDAQIDRGNFDTLASVLRYAHSLAERQALLAAILPAGDTTPANAQAAGVGVGLCELLLRDDSGIPPRAFTDVSLGSEVAGTPREKLAAVARDHFDAMTGDASERRDQAAIWLQARLYAYALERLKAAGFDTQRGSVSGLRLLWRAWNEARTLRT